MYPMEVNYGVSSSKNIIPMSSENPRHWLIRFVIGCGQFWLVPRTGEEKNDLDTQRNKAGVLRSESAAGKKQTSHRVQSVWSESGACGRLAVAAIRVLACRARPSHEQSGSLWIEAIPYVWKPWGFGTPAKKDRKSMNPAI